MNDVIDETIKNAVVKTKEMSHGKWDNIAEALERYWVHRLKPGKCLGAILVGDLYTAALHADNETAQNLAEIVKAIYWYAPRKSFGSHDYVMDWLDGR